MVTESSGGTLTHMSATWDAQKAVSEDQSTLGDLGFLPVRCPLGILSSQRQLRDPTILRPVQKQHCHLPLGLGRHTASLSAALPQNNQSQSSLDSTVGDTDPTSVCREG